MHIWKDDSLLTFCCDEKSIENLVHKKKHIRGNIMSKHVCKKTRHLLIYMYRKIKNSLGWTCDFSEFNFFYVTDLYSNNGAHISVKYHFQRLPSVTDRQAAINRHDHYNDVMMSAMASQNTSVSLVYSAVCSDADKRKHQSSVSLAFVWGIHRWSVHSPHKMPVTRKRFPFDGVIMHKPARNSATAILI